VWKCGSERIMYNVIAACCFALFACVVAGQTGGTPSHPHAFTDGTSLLQM
jgi:hypothetical protein